MRIGHGYDVHRFCEGSEIILGGVKIPYEQGLEAHSDGDVLLHALCDALLGALALGDIGKHFPDQSKAYKDIDSRKLLRKVIAMQGYDYQIANIDSTIIAEAPKMAKYITSMCSNIASDCRIRQEQVNVKATTTEKLGFIGKKEGIAVHVVVLLERINDDQ